MHTLFSRSLFGPPFLSSSFGRRLGVRLLVLLALTLGGVQVGWGQTDTRGSRSEVDLNLRVYPMDFWGPRVGPGAGIGGVVHNLGRRHSQVLATVAPAQHEQVATLSVVSASPERARQYLFLTGRGLHTDRRWFYGLGPASGEDTRLAFRQTTARAQIGFGQQLFDRRLHVRPLLTLHHIRTTGLSGPSSELSSRSQRHVERLRGSGPPGPRQTGLQAGARLQYDTKSARDSDRPSLRLHGSWHRYVDLSGSSLAFDQLKLSARGTLSLSERHRLRLRTGLARTWSRDSAPVPFYHRPTLDGSVVPGWARSRFVGNDRLMAQARYQFPLVDASPFITLDGHVGVHAAAVYDHLPSQFAPVVSFERTLSPDASTYPVRPSASVGLTFRVPVRPRTTVDVALGASPEGLAATRLTIQRPLHRFRPPHHSSR
ncbi:MAG: hypothetical protein R6T83_02770 [Salinibacter sp.]